MTYFSSSSSGNGVSIFIGLALCIVLLIIVKGCEAVTCVDVGETTGRNVHWTFYSGCYVEVNDKMIPLDSWRGEQD